MTITVLFFATLKDLAGAKKVSLNVPPTVTTIKDLRHHIIGQYPHMEANLNAALASINEEFAFADDTIKDGDEVAFFPPVSGGSGADERLEIYKLPHEPISHDDLVNEITTPATGAVCFFSGVVRGETDKAGHIPQTDYLEYEAYEPMALAKMKQVTTEIRERWPLVQGIAMVQRLGKLAVGDNTVLIACSSAHRDDGCFEAARYGIDRLKEIVPVWKKEVGPDGEAWVEGDYKPDAQDRA